MSFLDLAKISLVTSAAFAFGITGCGTAEPKKGGTPKAETPGKHVEDAHAHPTEGPHKGHLIELGKEEYHAELVHDDATKTVSVYLLDAKGEKAVSIKEQELTMNLVVDKAPKQVVLGASPQPSDPPGESSLFTVTDEAVLEALEAESTTGRLNITIAGKSYTGNIEHHEHDEKKK